MKIEFIEDSLMVSEVTEHLEEYIEDFSSLIPAIWVETVISKKEVIAKLMKDVKKNGFKISPSNRDYYSYPPKERLIDIMLSFLDYMGDTEPKFDVFRAVQDYILTAYPILKNFHKNKVSNVKKWVENKINTDTKRNKDQLETLADPEFYYALICLGKINDMTLILDGGLEALVLKYSRSRLSVASREDILNAKVDSEKEKLVSEIMKVYWPISKLDKLSLGLYVKSVAAILEKEEAMLELTMDVTSELSKVMGDWVEQDLQELIAHSPMVILGSSKFIKDKFSELVRNVELLGFDWETLISDIVLTKREVRSMIRFLVADRKVFDKEFRRKLVEHIFLLATIKSNETTYDLGEKLGYLYGIAEVAATESKAKESPVPKIQIPPRDSVEKVISDLKSKHHEALKVKDRRIRELEKSLEERESHAKEVAELRTLFYNQANQPSQESSSTEIPMQVMLDKIKSYKVISVGGSRPWINKMRAEVPVIRILDLMEEGSRGITSIPSKDLVMINAHNFTHTYTNMVMIEIEKSSVQLGYYRTKDSIYDCVKDIYDRILRMEE